MEIKLNPEFIKKAKKLIDSGMYISGGRTSITLQNLLHKYKCTTEEELIEKLEKSKTRGNRWNIYQNY